MYSPDTGRMANSRARFLTHDTSSPLFVVGLGQVGVLIGQVNGADEDATGEEVEETQSLTFAEAYAAYNGNVIVGGLVGVIVVAILLAVVRSSQAVSSYGRDLPRDVRKQVKQFELAGNFVAAADLLFQSGAFDDAAELYIKADDHMRAGEALEKAGKINEAVRHYKRAGAPLVAGDAYARRSQFSSAGREYALAGNTEKAAEAFFKGKSYREAADLFIELQRYERAGDALERLGDKEAATDAYVKYFELQYEIARGDPRQIPDAAKLASKAAELMVGLDQKKEAAALLQKAGYLKRAAELYARLGMVEEAAAIYVEAKKPMFAAKLYDSIGDQKRALLFRGEARLLKGDKKSAAEDFRAAGEYARAAELFNELGSFGEAAAMYEAATDVRTAAELYTLAGEHLKAASAYEKAGDFEQATVIYRNAGDFRSELRAAKSGNNFFRVGEILLEHERVEDALAAFQRVDSTDQHYERSNMMQGDILRKLGRFDVALAKYKLAIGDSPASPSNVDTYYKMAEAAEESGALALALEHYETVIGLNYHHRDAAEKARRVREKLGSHAGARSASAGAPQPQNGRYVIVEEIARGGMGIVYKATDSVLERTVAYKILAANLKTNDTAVKYFLREARAAAKMSHPNIVTVFDAGEQDGEFYMAMEYVEGRTLKSIVNRQGAFPEKLVRYVMVHVCRGLAYAHARGLVHRDVKPGNLMLAHDRTVKIMDFGLAKFVEEVAANHTRAIGTPYYMSPEQIIGEELDGRSDIYSLGISMFECATGQVPFSKGDLSYHHLKTEPPEIKSINAKVSDDLASIIHQCMKKKPDDRFRTVEELLAALKE